MVGLGHFGVNIFYKLHVLAISVEDNVRCWSSES